MSFTYYLPMIIFAAVVIAALIWVIWIVRDVIRASKDEVTCMYCKATASKISKHEYLFLIPAFFGDKYNNEESYLYSHMKPIRGKDQILSGQRAYRAEVYSCSKCDKKQVGITDFLQVRGEEYIKGSYVFAYESFRHLLEDREIQNDNLGIIDNSEVNTYADNHIKRRYR